MAQCAADSEPAGHLQLPLGPPAARAPPAAGTQARARRPAGAQFRVKFTFQVGTKRPT